MKEKNPTIRVITPIHLADYARKAVKETAHESGTYSVAWCSKRGSLRRGRSGHLSRAPPCARGPTTTTPCSGADLLLRDLKYTECT